MDQFSNRGYTRKTLKTNIEKVQQHTRQELINLPVPAHFRAAGHSVSQFKLQIIDSVPALRRGGNRLLTLQKLEIQWIHRSNTVWPRGLNKDYTPVMFIY
ncbi:hypothetical protein XELAEV_18023903mg [Xenopus laevis]|uniref:Uncharacterized protein n=1 Tax=Xenopus laevis TaxID=8355 RepID=A0A974D5W5_XENLA|nr:hypothetical protein XELAEV_18023903mg [Xenopus laevis]